MALGLKALGLRVLGFGVSGLGLGGLGFWGFTVWEFGVCGLGFGEAITRMVLGFRVRAYRALGLECSVYRVCLWRTKEPKGGSSLVPADTRVNEGSPSSLSN